MDRSGLKVTWGSGGGNRGGESVTRINKQFPKCLTGQRQCSTSQRQYVPCNAAGLFHTILSGETGLLLLISWVLDSILVKTSWCH